MQVDRNGKEGRNSEIQMSNFRHRKFTNSDVSYVTLLVKVKYRLRMILILINSVRMINQLGEIEVFKFVLY